MTEQREIGIDGDQLKLLPASEGSYSFGVVGNDGEVWKIVLKSDTEQVKFATQVRASGRGEG